MSKYESIVDAGYAFLGIKNTAEDVREFYAGERPSVEELAKTIGVVLVSEADDDYVVDVNGLTHVSTSMPTETEYAKAIAVGSYILYGKTPVDLSSDRMQNVQIFAVTVVAPGLKEHTADQPTPGDLIKLSRKFDVPFATLKALFQIK